MPETESAFGSWRTAYGLPVFDEDVHPDVPVCRWDPVLSPATQRHWCAVGNRRLHVVFDNGGTAAVRDTAHLLRWLTPVGPGSGATRVVTDGRTWGTDLDSWPPGEAVPRRTWGPTWMTVAVALDGLRLERTVGCPEGELPWLLVRTRLTCDHPRSLDLVEEWRVAGALCAHDARGAVVTAPEAQLPSTRVAALTPPDRVEAEPDGDGFVMVRLVRRLELRAGQQWEQWSLLGLGDDEPGDPAGLWADSLGALRDRLPSATCDRIPALEREVPWHAALLTGGASTDLVLGGHTLDQGSAYSFDLRFNGAARDPLQHALPLVYTEPDLALSVLRNTCAWAGPSGELPYALDERKQRVSFGYQPSDQALWALWLAAEYAAATGDLDAFRAHAPYHPSYDAPSAPLVQHLVGMYRHLLDKVGTGRRGHLRIRNADWNDSALTLAGIDHDAMLEHGESVLNSAMAAWVLPRFAGLLRRLDDPALRVVADEADARAAAWRDLVAGEWNGRWYRRAYGPGAVVGDDELWLEVQPWAILCGAAEPDRGRELLRTIDEVVRVGSPLGARVRGPAPIVVPEGRVAGEGSAGGVWFSISLTLAWAAAELDPDLAWDELRRMTLAAHTAAYPGIWEGTLSGPDSYNTPESPRAGATWAWPSRGIGMQSFPVNNLHCHAQPLLTYLRLLGVEPAADGALRVGTGGGAFASKVFRLTADGHGQLVARGPVLVRALGGEASTEGGLLSW